MKVENQKVIPILGVPVASLTFDEVIKLIEEKCQSKMPVEPFFLVTAYSESFLEAQKNPDFRHALTKADLIVPDGISVFEAMEYLATPKQHVIVELIKGLFIGLKTITGGYPERISGVRILQKILNTKYLILNTKKIPSIFLLGGFNGVSKKLAEKFHVDYYDGPKDITKITQQEENSIFQALKEAKPDMLFVSFGRFRQEIWIAKHRSQLHAKVVIGVGSAFDELLGEGKWSKKVPSWVEKMGLKWLWRITIDPSHITRAWRAFPVFPWKVFLSHIS